MGVRTALPGVPFLDLGRVQVEIKNAFLADLETLIDTSAFINGAPVREFELQFADFAGTSTCVGVASGLDALRLGLIAAGLEPGDEVAVPAATFAATFEAVTQAGGVPLVVDVRSDDYGLDLDALASQLTPRTRFVMPVHLYGQMMDVRGLMDLASRDHLRVIADSCQAHGARRDGTTAGQRVDAAGFSFYPGKNLGAFGDAGALVTDDDRLASKVRALREHGQTAKYQHAYQGWTSRLDTIQAIVLLHKLRYLESWNEERRASALCYLDALAGVGDLSLPAVAPGSDHAWHLFVVRTRDPEALALFLAERGIGTGRHYPEPPHLSPAFAHLQLREGSMPVAEALSRECLSLPMFPGLTETELDGVVDGIRAYFDG